MGNRVPLGLRCVDGSKTPTAPTQAPIATVYGDDGSFVQTVLMPVRDQDDVTGWFTWPLQLDQLYTTGRHAVVYHYMLSSTIYASLDHFEVVSSGDADGVVIAMYYFRHPSRDYLLAQTDGGMLRKLRNPRLTT